MTNEETSVMIASKPYIWDLRRNDLQKYTKSGFNILETTEKSIVIKDDDGYICRLFYFTPEEAMKDLPGMRIDSLFFEERFSEKIKSEIKGLVEEQS